MGAVPQYRVNETGEIPESGAGVPPGGSEHPAENPIELLREAIQRLNASPAAVPDRAQLENVLAEARAALERANVVARASAQCEIFINDEQFPLAIEALDTGLLIYPGDPALTARRAEVQRQQEEFLAAAAVRAILAESDWFLRQDRIDLAVQFLKDKTASAHEPALAARLNELEEQLPAWQEERDVQAALGRSKTLEQLAQWQGALTLLEEALRAYPESAELRKATERVGFVLADQERQKRLARRIELIRAEVSQAIADGDLELAEQALTREKETVSVDPALGELRKELESQKRYRDVLRRAQVSFGRRQFKEAEQILAGIAGHPEAGALLDAVRKARTANEEENLLEHGREKVLELMQRHDYAQASDLLSNLLLLFPGNPILEKDLAAARQSQQRETVEVVPPPEPESKPVPAPVIEMPKPERVEVAAEIPGFAAAAPPAPRRWKRAAIAAAASVLLGSAGGAAWKLSRSSAPAAKRQTAPVAVQPALPPPTASEQSAAPETPQPPAKVPEPETKPVAATKAAAAPASSNSSRDGGWRRAPQPRQFVPPAAAPVPGQTQRPVLPAPPASEPIITAEVIPSLPSGIAKPGTLPKAPAPPPAPVTGPGPAATAKPAAPMGGKLQEAQLITRVMPRYPDVARTRGIYGTVKLEAVVDEHGTVKNVKVLSGPPVLAGAAKTAVEQWKYKPAILDGQAIATSVAVQVVFQDGKL